MAKKKLASYVTVHDSEGVAHTFAPGDDLPKWARDSITNPNVWSGDDDSQDASSVAEGPAGAGVQENSAGDPTQPPADGSLAVPPLNGAGSSKDAWRDYAGKAAEKAGLQIDIPAEAKRDDIVEALRSAGIPVE